MSDAKLYTFEIIKRKKDTPGGLGLVRYTTKAATMAEATKYFHETYGVGDIVAGPSLAKDQDS